MTVVFISWSGDISRDIAEELRNWIPSVLQFARPYYTPNDIEKGAKWSSEISSKLSEANVGIICLTKENYQKPWILFEAEALSKDLENSKVCSILFGMENSDVSGPLTTFQTTQFRRDDFKKMMNSINEAGGDKKLSPETFDLVFNMWWPQLESKISAILNKEYTTDEAVRSDRELLEEILLISRSSMARSSSRDTGIVSQVALEELLGAVAEIIRHYERDEEKSNRSAIEALLKVTEYLTRKAQKGYRYMEDVKRLRIEFDDIIPF